MYYIVKTINEMERMKIDVESRDFKDPFTETELKK